MLTPPAKAHRATPLPASITIRRSRRPGPSVRESIITNEEEGEGKRVNANECEDAWVRGRVRGKFVVRVTDYARRVLCALPLQLLFPPVRHTISFFLHNHAHRQETRKSMDITRWKEGGGGVMLQGCSNRTFTYTFHFESIGNENSSGAAPSIRFVITSVRRR